MLVLVPVLLVVLLILSRKNPGFRYDLLQRLGWSASGIKKHSLLIHAASVGEVIAIKPLVLRVQELFPDLPVTVTTFTPTGADEAKRQLPDSVQHTYLPLDNPISVWLFLWRVKPKMIMLTETEIWPCLIRLSQWQDVSVGFINGRLSTGSMRTYRKLSGLLKPVLRHIDFCLVQDDTYAARFQQLGVPSELTKVEGNLKYDIKITEAMQTQADEIRHHLGNRPVLVVGSTHEGEDQLLLDMYKHWHQQHPDLLMAIAPRHVPRFAPVYDEARAFAEANEFKCQRRSEHDLPDGDCQIFILDTLGELMSFYGVADVTLVAGSLLDYGGHNPLEPAAFGRTVVVGPYTQDFADVCETMRNSDALVQAENAKALEQSIAGLLMDAERRKELALNASEVVSRNRGTTTATCTLVEDVLEQDKAK